MSLIEEALKRQARERQGAGAAPVRPPPPPVASAPPPAHSAAPPPPALHRGTGGWRVARLVLVLLALLVFGGVALLFWRDRSGQSQPTPAATAPGQDDQPDRTDQADQTDQTDQPDRTDQTDQPDQPNPAELVAAVALAPGTVVPPASAPPPALSAPEQPALPPPAPPAPPTPSVPWPIVGIKGIAVGANRVVILDSGEMLDEGEESASGVLIRQIGADFVVMEWQGQTKRLRKGETSDKPLRSGKQP